MSRIAYVNGRYLPRRDATVHIEDRGYQFADGVYEVCEVRGGRLVDERRHMARLAALARRVAHRHADVAAALGVVLRETVRAQPRARRHRLSADHPRRGAARSCLSGRRHRAEPWWSRRAASTSPATNAPPPRASRSSPCRTTAGSGSTSSRSSLLPNVLAKQAAREQGAEEAWFVDRDGRVTEGSSTNAWIVTRDGEVVTRPADNGILRGITRTVLIEAIKAQGLTFEERAFTVEEAYGAREAFITSASHDRHAGRPHRRPAGRRRRAGPAGERVAARFPSLRRVGLTRGFCPAQSRCCPQLVLAQRLAVFCNGCAKSLRGKRPKPRAK